MEVTWIDMVCIFLYSIINIIFRRGECVCMKRSWVWRETPPYKSSRTFLFVIIGEITRGIL